MKVGPFVPVISPLVFVRYLHCMRIMQFPESYVGGESRDLVHGGSEGAAAHPRTSFANPTSQSPAVAVDLSSSEEEVHVEKSITASEYLLALW